MVGWSRSTRSSGGRGPSTSGGRRCASGEAPGGAGGGPSEGSSGTAGVFTDGHRVFQPVPSATGQPLFTDGKQLYAPVCVVTPPGEAADPILAAACSAAKGGPGAARLPSSPGSTISLMTDWSDDELSSCADVGAEY